VAHTVASCVSPGGAVAGVDLNPGMLKVARRVCSTAHSAAQIEWHEASADKLPFSDARFNVVCCQLGLQFFPDRSAALREMRRVLVPGGRLAVMVWRGIHESPGFAVLAEALEQHVGRAAAAIMRAPFGLSDVEELTALVRATGFHDIVIQQRVGTVRFPSIEKLVSSYIAGSPLAGPVSQINDAARQTLVADVRNRLGKYVTDTELAFPIAAHLLSARA
jgi:SAM-dependent methyltransferase